MSKPLKLTIHPRLEDTNLSADDIHQGELTTHRLAQSKRLTDAELAAEYWAQHHDAQHAMTCEMAAGNEAEQKACSEWRFSSVEKADAIRRFAISPHYFEVDQ